MVITYRAVKQFAIGTSSFPFLAGAAAEDVPMSEGGVIEVGRGMGKSVLKNGHLSEICLRYSGQFPTTGHGGQSKSNENGTITRVKSYIHHDHQHDFPSIPNH
jgi:hypothetical protein